MRLLVLADNAPGLQIVDYLVQNYPDDLSLVVVMGRNKIYDLAREQRIPVCDFDSMDASMLPDKVDLGLLAWWPKILKSPLLDVPRFGFVNTHPSLLPHNRGKHYNFWALVEQAPFGVTLHRVDSGIDTGDIIAQEQIPYDWTDNGESLYFKAQAAMVNLFRRTYPVLRTGQVTAIPQDRQVGSFHHSCEIEKASNIDLDRLYRGRDLINLLRARSFEGYPGCWFEDSGSRYEVSIKITKVKA